MSQTPREVVEEFFERMSDDDQRDTASELFAEDAVITLPGTRFEGERAATEMLEWLAPRYERAEKEFERWIEAGSHVVNQGSLYGVAADGSGFEDVRYVDVYRIEDGRIARVDIYNDLAAEGVVG